MTMVNSDVPLGTRIPGGTLLKVSEIFPGDGVTRPYQVRLVVRDQQPHPFVLWVYFLDEDGGRAHGDYYSTLELALKRWPKKCALWQVEP